MISLRTKQAIYTSICKMTDMKSPLLIFSILLLSVACQAQETPKDTATMKPKIEKTDSEWKAELAPDVYRIMREAGTERPFTGEYNLHFEDGAYRCGACNAVLFSSDAKFESHCGWPSFDKAADNDAIIEREDRSFGMVRTEVLCANCGGHLGHLFDDGPTETGMRYCINSLALDFESASDSTSTSSDSQEAK
jgi:peptide-methionine (R)-S-oxide reductase